MVAQKKYNLGLVLSGGGTRGFAHLGLMAALHENELYPDVISGASAGAIAGAFMAAKKPIEEVYKIFAKNSVFKYSGLQLPSNGLLKLDGLKEVIKKEIEYEKIEDLPIPFYISLSNLTKGCVEYKNEGNIAQTVLASSSIPVLFSPVKIGKYLYVDGGVMDNLPVEPIRKFCKKIIVSNISPVKPKEQIRNIFQIASRTFYMSVNQNAETAKQLANLVVEHKGIDNFDILSNKKAEELYEIGYQSTIEALKDF